MTWHQRYLLGWVWIGIFAVGMVATLVALMWVVWIAGRFVWKVV